VSAVRFTKRAREDLFDIWLHVAPRNSEAVADAIYDRIEARCQALRDFPEIGRARPEIAEGARSLSSSDGWRFIAWLRMACWSCASSTAPATSQTWNGPWSRRLMNQLAVIAPAQLPALIAASGDRASWRFMECFTAAIRNLKS